MAGDPRDLVDGVGARGEVDEVIVTKSATHARTLRPDVFVVPFPSNRWQYAMLALASREAQAVARLSHRPVERDALRR